MTVASPQTVEEIIGEQERRATPGAANINQVSTNQAQINQIPQTTPRVRYIRPAPEPDKSKFTIKTEQEEEGPKFFARVKVLKSS
jgi:hypothetical protein